MFKILVIVGVCGLIVGCGEAGSTPPADRPTAKVKVPDTGQKTAMPVNPNTATAPKWTVDKAKSSLEFIGVQSGEKFTGKFANYDAQIYFDPTNLKGSKVVATIDMNSADAGDAERNDALPGKEWFYTKKFPVAQYQATSFVRVKDGAYIAKGALTMRGTSLPLDLPFKLNITKIDAVMDAEVNIDRTKFDVGIGVWENEDWANHTVLVRVHLAAQKVIQK